jgi:fumarate reductase subunit C
VARKPYSQPQPRDWWLKNSAYRRYMLREATAIPLLLYCLLLMSGIYRLTQGSDAFAAWLIMLRSPWAVALHSLAFAAALFHTWTWFALVPKILVIQTRRLRVDGKYIKFAHWIGAALCFLTLLILAAMLFSGIHPPGDVL